MRAPQILLLASALVAAFPANQSTNADELISSAPSQIASKTQLLPEDSVSGQLRAEQSYIQSNQSAGETSASADAGEPSPEVEDIDGVDGYDRHKGHKCHKGHKGHKDKAKCEGEKEEGHKCGSCGGCEKGTPTYHICVDSDDSRYKTISLPAQGCPYVYGDDVRNSLPPLVDHDCCQRYCYAPCQQPTCGMFGSCPPQRLCYHPCDPCCHHLEACCPQPPPPQPCCPPPPFIYDECCDPDHKKHKKCHKKKKFKKGGEEGYHGRYADSTNNNNYENNNNVNGNPREEDENS
ncbi:hypothetical protein LPJ64_000234 [Coemansia asiatica]|uniref:Uncharacterized protein n=1 Tax=Coemansia asiatica TaxID=1052880 RepID=A0A9W8CLS1_9FUNG|nr:hypothetical protein LPJ64_000234 [Coemansia asiatica]